MKTHNWAKIFGWVQFIASVIANVVIPTHPIGWIGEVASLATAVAVHAASSTDGTK